MSSESFPRLLQTQVLLKSTRQFATLRSKASRSSRARSAHAKCLVKNGSAHVQLSFPIPGQEAVRARSLSKPLRRSYIASSESMEWRDEPGATLLLWQCQERKICCSQNLKGVPSRNIRVHFAACQDPTNPARSRRRSLALERVPHGNSQGGGGKVSKLGAAAKASSSS